MIAISFINLGNASAAVLRPLHLRQVHHIDIEEFIRDVVNEFVNDRIGRIFGDARYRHARLNPEDNNIRIAVNRFLNDIHAHN